MTGERMAAEMAEQPDRLAALVARWDGAVAQVRALASRNPARVLGLDGHKGRLAAGHDADLVVLDEALRPVATMAGGRWATAPPS